MEFDENKVISPLHKENAKLYDCYFFSDNLVNLKHCVEQNCSSDILWSILSEKETNQYTPFKTIYQDEDDFSDGSQFLYPVDRELTLFEKYALENLKDLNFWERKNCIDAYNRGFDSFKRDDIFGIDATKKYFGEVWCAKYENAYYAGEKDAFKESEL